MKQKLRFLLTMLLCAALGQTWANETVAYTFTTPKGESGYNNFKDVTIDGVKWNVPGNQYADGELRLGGKSIENVDRVITGLGSLSDAITKITVNHSGTNSDNLIVNSVTVTVASDANFSNVIETITLTPEVKKEVSGSFDFTPNSGSWSENSYYKFAFNLTNTKTSNYAIKINSIVFYMDDGNTGPIDPTVTLDVTNIKVGETTSISFPNNLSVTFESDDTDVASVSTTGVITGNGKGDAIISVEWEGDDNYNEGSTEFTVHVSKYDATVTLEKNTIKVGKTTTISYPEDLTISFESDDEDVATVDEEGVITGVKAGSTTITAAWGDEKYNEGSAEFTVTVTEGSNGIVFVPVTDTDQLVAGNEYLIVSYDNNRKNYYAMGTKVSNSNAAKAEVVVCENDEIEITNEEVVVLTLGGETDAWTFTTSDDMGDLCITSNTSNVLNYTSLLQSLSDEKMKLWTITSEFEIKNNMFGERYIQYNYNSGNPRFAGYKNNQIKAYLYVKKGSATSDTKTASLEIGNMTLAIPGMGISETTISSVPEDLVFTLSSSDESYATVSGNKVTAVKVGEATITATWEEQTVDGYVYAAGSRTFAITIIEPEDGYYDFTNLVLDYGSNVTPTENNSVYADEESTWTAGNVKMEVNGKYRWWLSDGTLRIYQPTSLTFTTLPNYVITKIELTGKNLGSIISEEGTYSNNTWEGFASSVTLSRDGSSNPQIKSIKVTYMAPYTLAIGNTATDGHYYYATLSNLGNGNYIVPEGVELSTIIVNDKRQIEATKVFSPEDIIPGDGAFLVTADEPGEYIFKPSDSKEEVRLEQNWLYPAEKDVTIPAPVSGLEYVYYKLSLNKKGKENSVGFYWGDKDGAPFAFTTSNKAYLAIEKTTEASDASAILFDATDGISNVSDNATSEASAYTLSGIRMEGTALPKGIYIVNGKKLVVK